MGVFRLTRTAPPSTVANAGVDTVTDEVLVMTPPVDAVIPNATGNVDPGNVALDLS